VRYMTGHHMAFRHVCDIAAVALAETHQHTPFSRNQSNRQARPVAIAPVRPVHGRQHDSRLELADMAKRVFECTLLDGHLGLRMQVLHGTAPTYAEMGATRLYPLR